MSLSRRIHCLAAGKCTLLHYAVFCNYLPEIHRLMENGADIDARSVDGETALHYACYGNSDCIEAILKYNPSMNVAEKRERVTPLIMIVKYLSNRTSTLRMMLEMGADPNLSQRDGDTPLHIIAKADHTQRERAVRYALELIKFNANVNAQNNYGNTPLHTAIKTGYTEIIEFFLRNGASLKIRNSAGQTPIQYAFQYQMDFDGPFIEIGKYIIEQASIGRQLICRKCLAVFFELSDLKLFREKCNQELSNLKSSVTDRTSVTFYDLLVLPLHVVGKYLRNEDILKSAMALDKTKYIFGKQLSKIFRDALLRNEAIDIGYEFFRKFCPLILPDFCMDGICKYLTNNDLLTLKNFTC